MGARLRVPQGCGTWFADPPLERLGDLVRGAHASLGGGRDAARAEILSLAAAQTGEMDGQRAAIPDVRRPLFATGHQPDLYHPGIWAKNFILDAVCRAEGFTGLNLTVDADLASRVVELPLEGADGTWHRHGVALPGIRAGLPWEAQAPLDAAAWEAFGDAVRASLPRVLAAPFDAFMRCVRTSAPVLRARTLADSLARARRAWESAAGPRAYLELDVSSMCGTAAFHDFVAAVLSRLEAFWEIHNDVLRGYREQHRIRSGANPVPDLRRRGDLWETPFWCIHPGGERGGLFLERDGQGWKVESKDTTYGRLEDGDEGVWARHLAAMLAAGRSAVRPRALTLTMFVRRTLADVFLHGIGGARYERVGDAMARRFFGEGGAPYAAASATLCLDALGDGAPLDDAAALRRQLRDLAYNPQRFIPGGDARKQRLVEAVALAPRGVKKQVGAEIAEVNAHLRGRLADTEASLRARLEAAEEARARGAVTRWRGYPYFLFEAAEVRRLIEGG